MTDLHELDWEDLRVFVALARATSLREGAARLGLTHPTVRRRLDSLEGTLGVKLFHRRSDGLHLTVAGQAMREASGDVELAVRAVLRGARSLDHDLKGPVRVTITTELARVMAPALSSFCRTWPSIQLLVDTSGAFADLSRSEADVAVRAYRQGRVPEDHLAGRKAVSGCQAVYGDAASGRWIGSRLQAPRSGWTATDEFADYPIGSVIPDVIARHAACVAGMGIAMMPCPLGDSDLTRLTAPTPDFDIWVLVHPDLRRNPRLRIFRDAMVDALASMEAQMNGRS